MKWCNKKNDPICKPVTQGVTFKGHGIGQSLQ